MAPHPTEEHRFLRRPLRIILLVLVILLAASLLGDRGLIRLIQMHQTRAALAREVERLSATNAALADEVRALRTDPGRIEAIAREELGLVKPGELVYEFRGAPPAPAPAGNR
jgi:cell division protein FtsB